MKGLVLTFRKNPKAIRLPDISKQKTNAKLFLSKYGLQIIFSVLFLFGLVVGAALSKELDSSTFDKLDLLFVTNINTRLEMSVFDIFVSCFVSCFLFMVIAFLSGFTPWGCVVYPLLSAFKGFTVGLSSALIFSVYRLSGIGFYILVILPGAVLFLFTLIKYSVSGFSMSLRYFRLTVFGCDKEPKLSEHIRAFLKKTVLAFISCGACAVIDMALWILFAHKFEF